MLAFPEQIPPTNEMVHADNTSHSNKWKSVDDSWQQDYMDSLARACNCPSLTAVLKLTVMDFHVAQFQRPVQQMFSYLFALDQYATQECHSLLCTKGRRLSIFSNPTATGE